MLSQEELKELSMELRIAVANKRAVKLLKERYAPKLYLVKKEDSPKEPPAKS
jgi:hypothetical protein